MKNKKPERAKKETNLTKVNWDKYGTDSIDFLLDQSDKLIDETFKSFREITTRSYIALGIYISIISYFLSTIINQHPIQINTLIPNLLIVVGIVICMIQIWPNLIPTKMSFPGSEPNKLIQPYFEQFENPLEQLKKYKIAKIEDYDNGIISNKEQIDKRNVNFKKSIKCLLITFLLSFLFATFFWLLGPQCFPG